ncbi:MAG: hypothetical protein RMJ35_12715, partial [Phycisphaerales bacterium]|nr:hypothetical protein [Phycisphaerales bacterium]
LPASLDALVPGYLPTVPADPMAAGKPLNYRSGAEAILWSVGENGVDDQASEALRDPARSDDPGRWDRLDVVVRLTRPTTQPSSD